MLSYFKLCRKYHDSDARDIQLLRFTFVEGVSDPSLRYTAAEFGIRNPSDNDAL